MQLYLPPASLPSTDILTAKSSELNVVVMGGQAGDEGAELQECALPEQFVSRYRDGRFVTEPVSHSGG